MGAHGIEKMSVVAYDDNRALVVEQKVLEKLGEKVWRVEGLGNRVWVVMDYGDVMVHVFQTETRDFYKLEQLWADAPVREYAEEQ